MDIHRIFTAKISRWTVLQIDIYLCIISVLLSFFLRFNFNIPIEAWDLLPFTISSTLSIKLILFYRYKPYAGIIRYTSIEDAKKIFKALTISFGILVVFNLVIFYVTGILLSHFSVLVMDYFITMLLMAAFRIVAKISYFEYRLQNSKRINVIIFGAGEVGMMTKRTLTQYSGSSYNVVAFVDDDPKKSKNMIEGVQIYYTNGNFAEFIKEKMAEEVVIAAAYITPKRKQEIVDVCLAQGIKVRTIPPVEKWINGEFTVSQIKELRIEDILGRPSIKLDNILIKKQIEHKVVLITGAAGSIGSEIARQLIGLNPRLLLLLDQSESALHELSLDISEMTVKINHEAILGDIRNIDRMKRVFDRFKPNLVFHAAAYKHVPMIEENPTEAILTNIKGTKILADLCVKHEVEKFVMISTDKAVNPTNVMGASKRIAEIYIQSLNRWMEAERKVTRFVTTRFGNVLGSNGSVIPRFKKQIAEGGPITVTHPEITRYFMTIPEAVQLVLEAGAMGNGGEIFIFDMGESVKITDLAKKMIMLSGLTLGKDIQLVFTGLRPGEKLYEELLNDNENTIPTHHPKIMKAKVREYEFSEVTKDVLELIKLFDAQNNDQVIFKMKEIVPEFISNNSIYERLDKIILEEKSDNL